MKPTAKQVKEFWGKCGFTMTWEDEWNWVLRKDGNFVRNVAGNHLYPPIDLNNLFKYAVPKLGGLNLRLELALTAYSDASDYKIGRGFGTKLVYACSIYTADYQKMVSQATDDDLTLALFWAIYEVIK